MIIQEFVQSQLSKEPSTAGSLESTLAVAAKNACRPMNSCNTVVIPWERCGSDFSKFRILLFNHSASNSKFESRSLSGPPMFACYLVGNRVRT